MGCSASINLEREHWQSNQSCIREEAERPLLSVIREPGLIVLLRHLLLSHKTLIETWLMLLEEGRESHCVITGLNSLHSTIQSPIAGEEISERPPYWVESGTLLL